LQKDVVLKRLNKVTKEDIIRLANTLKFVFTYVLGGKSHD